MTPEEMNAAQARLYAPLTDEAKRDFAVNSRRDIAVALAALRRVRDLLKRADSQHVDVRDVLAALDGIAKP